MMQVFFIALICFAVLLGIAIGLYGGWQAIGYTATGFIVAWLLLRVSE